MSMCARANLLVTANAEGVQAHACLLRAHFGSTLSSQVLDTIHDAVGRKGSGPSFTHKTMLSPRTLSLFYIENTSVHRKVCRRMVVWDDNPEVSISIRISG